MQKIISQITDQLIGLVKKDQPYYTPKQLLKAEVPSYIVDRVRLYLEDKMQEGFTKPGSDWVSNDEGSVIKAWESYLEKVADVASVPKDKLHGVLHHVIGEIIAVFLEPRKKMATYLFREEQILSFDEMSKRCERLTIYKHFGTAIPLYMKKRNLEEISLERCQQLISNLDARIVSNYTAENWAQKLDMLFTLFGGRLKPELLKIFFEDKGYHKAANIFSSIDVAITQSTFIEMLSNEKLEIEEVPEKKEAAENKEKKSALIESFYDDSGSDSVTNIANSFEAGVTDEEMNDILGDISEGGIIEVDNTKEVESLNALFTSEEGKTTEGLKTSADKDEEMQKFRSNLVSILDQAKDALEGISSGDEEAVEEEFIEEDELIEEPTDEKVTELVEDKPVGKNEDSGEEEKPMWAQFISEEQRAVVMGSREDDLEEESLNDSLMVEDELIADENGPEKVPQSTLEDALSINESRWVNDIFKGSQKSYDIWVQKLSAFSSWEEAAHHVHNKIIKKNGIDMFSEESIEFINTLQNYFSEYKS